MRKARASRRYSHSVLENHRGIPPTQVCDGEAWKTAGGAKFEPVEELCDEETAGMVRFQGGAFHACDGIQWFTILGQPTPSPTINFLSHGRCSAAASGGCPAPKGRRRRSSASAVHKYVGLNRIKSG